MWSRFFNIIYYIVSNKQVISGSSNGGLVYPRQTLLLRTHREVESCEKTCVKTSESYQSSKDLKGHDPGQKRWAEKWTILSTRHLPICKKRERERVQNQSSKTEQNFWQLHGVREWNLNLGAHQRTVSSKYSTLSVWTSKGLTRSNSNLKSDNSLWLKPSLNQFSLWLDWWLYLP